MAHGWIVSIVLLVGWFIVVPVFTGVRDAIRDIREYRDGS